MDAPDGMQDKPEHSRRVQSSAVLCTYIFGRWGGANRAIPPPGVLSKRLETQFSLLYSSYETKLLHMDATPKKEPTNYRWYNGC